MSVWPLYSINLLLFAELVACEQEHRKNVLTGSTVPNTKHHPHTANVNTKAKAAKQQPKETLTHIFTVTIFQYQ